MKCSMIKKITLWLVYYIITLAPTSLEKYRPENGYDFQVKSTASGGTKTLKI